MNLWFEDPRVNKYRLVLRHRDGNPLSGNTNVTLAFVTPGLFVPLCVVGHDVLKKGRWLHVKLGVLPGDLPRLYDKDKGDPLVFFILADLFKMLSKQQLSCPCNSGSMPDAQSGDESYNEKAFRQ